MTKEEKEALKILNNTEWDGFMITIKNLVEKQHEEIKNLKEELNKKVEALDIAMSNPDYICKDKIRSKIKELEEYVKDFEEYWSKDSRKFKKEKCIDYYKLEALKELLKE